MGWLCCEQVLPHRGPEEEHPVRLTKTARSPPDAAPGSGRLRSLRSVAPSVSAANAGALTLTSNCISTARASHASPPTATNGLCPATSPLSLASDYTTDSMSDGSPSLSRSHNQSFLALTPDSAHPSSRSSTPVTPRSAVEWYILPGDARGPMDSAQSRSSEP